MASPSKVRKAEVMAMVAKRRARQRAVRPTPEERAALLAAGRDPDQWWFWTEEWQRGERAAEADIAAGRVQRFMSDEEMLTFLEENIKPPES